jgi:hypothetical protein
MLPYKVASEFYVKADDGSDISSAHFIWTASKGAIASGQETNKINLIPAKSDAASNVTIEVKISGLGVNCSTILSNEWGIYPHIEGDPVERTGKISRRDFISRLDNFFVVIRQNPKQVGILAVYFDKHSSREYRIKHLKDLLQILEWRHYDLSRLYVYPGVSDSEEETVYWLAPPHADLEDLRFDWTDLVKASDLSSKLGTLFQKK